MSLPEPEPSTASSLPESSNQEALVRLLREELIKTQLIVLDLNDRVLEKETEKADAVALLAKAEQVLEGKLNLIGELETAHANLREHLKLNEEQIRAKDLAFRDLSSALAAANEEITKLRAQSDEQSRNLALSQTTLNDARTQIEQLTASLAQSEESLSTARSQLTTVQRSALWKLGAPWRAVFGPRI